MFYTALRKKRAVGAVLLCILLVLFLLFNSIPKLDTVRADLAVKLPKAECFQGFCAEETPGSTLLSRWWDFSLTYLRLVAVGMVFAFLTAGLTEAFLYPGATDAPASPPPFRACLGGLFSLGGRRLG